LTRLNTTNTLIFKKDKGGDITRNLLPIAAVKILKKPCLCGVPPSPLSDLVAFFVYGLIRLAKNTSLDMLCPLKG